MEEPSDFKALCARFQSPARSATLPANLARTQQDPTPAPIVSNVRSNPALKGVISILENQNKLHPPPIAKKPELPVKPNNGSHVIKPLSNSIPNSEIKLPIFPRVTLSPETESMKLNKPFRQTLYIMDYPSGEGDQTAANRPQVYRRSCPTFPEPKPEPIQDCYQVVDSDFLTEANPPPTNNAKIANNSPSMATTYKPWRAVESDRSPSFPSHSPMTTDRSPDLGGVKGKENQLSSENKTPKLKFLQSIESLGPPPPKDPRPPKVDLSAFLTGSQQNGVNKDHEAESAESEYELPAPSPALYEDAMKLDESAESGCNVYEVEELQHETPEAQKHRQSVSSQNLEEERECYDDILELRASGADENLYEVEEIDTVPSPVHGGECFSEVSDANKELSAVTGTYPSHPSPASEGYYSAVTGTYPSYASSVSEGYYSAAESETDKRSVQRKETNAKDPKTAKSEEAFKKKFKISGQEGALYKSTIVEDFKPEKYMLPVKKGDVVDVIRITDCPTGKWLARDEDGHYGFVPVACVDISKDILSFSKKHLSLTLCNADIYSDVMGRTFDSGAGADLPTSPDSYPVKSEDMYDDVGNPTSSNSDGKSKGFRHLFWKDKSKNNDSGYGSVMPNSNTGSQDGGEYSTLGISEQPEKEKEDKSSSWRSIFQKNKEQKGKTESPETEGKMTVPPPIINKKSAKEEKIFREKFKYTGEIKVLSIATVSNMVPLSTKEKLELPIKPGESVEVIDVTNEDQIICRNFAGKYGYVRIKYLNFKAQYFD